MRVTHGSVAFGQVQGYLVPDQISPALSFAEQFKLWEPCAPLVNNTLLYDWAAIVQRLLRGSPDGKQYRIGGMYIEFNNGGTINPVPTISRSGWSEYYTNLNADNATRDYLRVPLIASSESNSDDTKYSLPNVATFHAQTVGTSPEGIHGLTFASGSSSYVYGGALVAFCDDDPTNDIVFSRYYYAAANQIQKVAGRQAGLSWPVSFL